MKKNQSSKNLNLNLKTQTSYVLQKYDFSCQTSCHESSAAAQSGTCWMMKCSNLTRKSFFHRSPSLPSSLPSHVLSSCSLNFASVKPERPLIQKASLSCSIPWPTGFFFFLLRLRCHSSFAFLPHFRSDHILPVCTWECFCSSYTVPVRHLAAAMLLVHQTCTSSTYTDNEKHRTSNTFNREKKKKRYIMEHYCSGCFLQGTAEWIICLHVTPTTSSFTKVTSNLLWALLLARQLQVCSKFKNGSKAEHPVKIQK